MFNKILAVLAYPFIFIVGYLYRLFIVDILFGLRDAILALISLNFLGVIGNLLWIPIMFVVDIFVGIYVSAVVSFGISKDIYNKSFD